MPPLSATCRTLACSGPERVWEMGCSLIVEAAGAATKDTQGGLSLGRGEVSCENFNR